MGEKERSRTADLGRCTCFPRRRSRDEAKLELRYQSVCRDEISDFPNHPFKVRMDEEMAANGGKRKAAWRPGPRPCAAERPDGRYEMVVRTPAKACGGTGGACPTIPCIVRNLTDDEAIIVMVDSNLAARKNPPVRKGVCLQNAAGSNGTEARAA